MASTRKSKLPTLLPPLLEQVADQYQDVTHLAGLSSDELQGQELPRLDLVFLGNLMYERQKQGRKLDPSADDYQQQLLHLEDEAGFFKVLFGVWWRDWDPFSFEEKLEKLKADLKEQQNEL